MSTLPPCTCGHRQLLTVPHLAVQLHRIKSVLGMTSYDGNIPWLHCTMVVCPACTRVTWYAANGAELQGIPGAQLVQAG